MLDDMEVLPRRGEVSLSRMLMKCNYGHCNPKGLLQNFVRLLCSEWC